MTLGLVFWAAIMAPTWSAECSVSTSGISFGIYDPLSGLSTDSAGTLDVSCDVSTPHTIALSSGSGSYSARQMTSGMHALFYNLYVDPERLTVWGDGTGGTATIGGSAQSASYIFFGRIDARQNAYVGSYSDTVVITLTF